MSSETCLLVVHKKDAHHATVGVYNISGKEDPSPDTIIGLLDAECGPCDLIISCDPTIRKTRRHEIATMGDIFISGHRIGDPQCIIANKNIALTNTEDSTDNQPIWRRNTEQFNV